MQFGSSRSKASNTEDEEFSEVCRVVKVLPYMTPRMASRLDRLISAYRLRYCLELGFYHGVSSAYIAWILRKNGGGLLTTVDLARVRSLKPNIETILRQLDLGRYVKIYYEERSYTWWLMKMLDAGYSCCFDFCYLDGGHTWDNTGFAFFLVTKLLKPGGWLLFDDLDWTLSSMQTDSKNAEWLRKRPPEEIHTRQIRKVWELLVKPHPDFGEFLEEGQWGFARKKC